MPTGPTVLSRPAGRRVYMVGIKGSGMAALAEILAAAGALVSGSDTSETFYTDELLRRAGIPYLEGFSAGNLPVDAELVVHSAAYDRATHPELTAAEARGLPILTYTQALGALSAGRYSVAVAGVHGKTTTTAMAGTLLRAAGAPAMVLVGSAVSTFDGRATYIGPGAASQEGRLFVAETCEYRRHFLDFRPRLVVITSVEADHLDYFRDEADVADAFVELAGNLPTGGDLVYCADDAGAASVAARVARARGDLSFHPYGFSATGRFRLLPGDEPRDLRLVALEDRPGAGNAAVRLSVPGRHNLLNAAGAIAVYLLTGERGLHPGGPDLVGPAMSGFRGTTRRAEVLGEAGGVLFMDDYAHHPTAIRTTLAGIREFYPGRRLVVDFMSHTFSRTRALLAGFADAFLDADEVLVHEIYPSARERSDSSISGRILADRIAERHPSVAYYPGIDDAEPYLEESLQNGDLFVTMGAGDNWRLSHRLYRRFASGSRRRESTL